MSEPSLDHLEVLDLAARGCMSGRMADWPQLQPAFKWAVNEIERLRTELDARFGDETEQSLRQERDELLNRNAALTEEIERLRAEVKSLHLGREQDGQLLAEAQAEIERLRAENKELQAGLDHYRDDIWDES